VGVIDEGATKDVVRVAPSAAGEVFVVCDCAREEEMAVFLCSVEGEIFAREVVVEEEEGCDKVRGESETAAKRSPKVVRAHGVVEEEKEEVVDEVCVGEAKRGRAGIVLGEIFAREAGVCVGESREGVEGEADVSELQGERGESEPGAREGEAGVLGGAARGYEHDRVCVGCCRGGHRRRARRSGQGRSR